MSRTRWLPGPYSGVGSRSTAGLRWSVAPNEFEVVPLNKSSKYGAWNATRSGLFPGVETVAVRTPVTVMVMPSPSDCSKITGAFDLGDRGLQGGGIYGDERRGRDGKSDSHGVAPIGGWVGLGWLVHSLWPVSGPFGEEISSRPELVPGAEPAGSPPRRSRRSGGPRPGEPCRRRGRPRRGSPSWDRRPSPPGRR